MADDQRPLSKKPYKQHDRDMYDIHGLPRPDPAAIAREASLYGESPIEGAFLEALLTPSDDFWHEVEPVLLRPKETYEWPAPGLPSDPAMFIVAPQHQLGPYRVDLACAYTLTGNRVVVECDGHEFHERTAEQAARDKSRDVALLLARWPVMRFTGSQINKDPKGCCAQVISFLTMPASREPGPQIVGIR